MQGRVPWACPLQKHWNLGSFETLKETPGEFRYLQITKKGFILVLGLDFVGVFFIFSDAGLNVYISFSATVGVRYNLCF